MADPTESTGVPARDLTSRDALRDDESGMTLVELIVYMMLMTLVIVIVGSVFISGNRVQKDATSMADASNNAQLAAATLEGPLRNAEKLQVPSSFGGDLLVAKTRVGEDNDDPASWRCVAFFYDRSTGAIYSTSSPVTGAVKTAGLTTGFSLSGWRLLVDDVAQRGSTPVFKTTGVGGGTTFTFDVTTTRDKAPVTIESSVIPRTQGAGIGVESCGSYA